MLSLSNRQINWIEREYLALNTIILPVLIFCKSRPIFYVPFFANTFINQFIGMFHQRTD